MPLRRRRAHCHHLSRVGKAIAAGATTWYPPGMNTHVRIDLPPAKARFTTAEFLRAAAGIAHHWVVDNDHAVIHVHGDLTDGDYALVETVRFGDLVAVPGTDATITLE